MKGVLIQPANNFPDRLGSFLLIFMALSTLSFLVTTPEAWVPALGDSIHGFPYLSGVGRLIIKDAIMLGAAVVTLADAAKASLRSQRPGTRLRRLLWRRWTALQGNPDYGQNLSLADFTIR
jgi:uncharacterized membrane protein YkgB